MTQLRKRTSAIAVLAGILASLFGPGQATAKLYAPYTYDGTYPSGSIDGTGSVGGTAPFTNGLLQLGFNQATNRLLVGHSTEGGRIFQFSATGTAEPFSFLAPNTAIASGELNTFGDVNVDNSGEGGGQVKANRAASTHSPKARPSRPGNRAESRTNPRGRLPDQLPGRMRRRRRAGRRSLGCELGRSRDPGVRSLDREPEHRRSRRGPHLHPGICSLAIDSNENFYAVDENGPILKYDSAGQLLGTVDPYSGRAKRKRSRSIAATTTFSPSTKASSRSSIPAGRW